jgi:hypothetical protein
MQEAFMISDKHIERGPDIGYHTPKGFRHDAAIGRNRLAIEKGDEVAVRSAGHSWRDARKQNGLRGTLPE